jgi:hypothetical protein
LVIIVNLVGSDIGNAARLDLRSLADAVKQLEKTAALFFPGALQQTE